MININNDLSLIPITSEDQSELFELMTEIYTPSYKHIWTDNGEWYLEQMYNPKTFQSDLDNPTSFYYFVLLQGWKIGILKYDFPSSPEIINFPNSLKLHRIYLHKDYQGKGIAAQLMRWVESVARERNLNFIWLEVMDTQVQAQRFYRKFGFEWMFTYHLEYKSLLQKYRGIQILRKSLKG